MEDTEKADSESIPKSGDASPSQGKSCALCGCATPAVRCDRCNSQIFCLSCDDMYHRHPKRKLHLRKAVDSIWSTARSPRLRRRTDLPGDPCKIPIPPPRTKKRERHTIGGRIFLKSGLELGSFGHSKVFDPKNLMPSPKDFFAGQKSPASLGESNLEEDTSNQIMRNENVQIYENDNVANSGGNVDANMDDRSPWNATRPNIASPIQVSIPSSSPDIVANGQSFGYPTKPHSQSAADLSSHAGHPPGHPPYHFHPPYPYMHPPMHPYSHSMAHLNCAQCLSSSWSNLMSPHPSPYFHPMPWGSAQNTMSRHPLPGQLKHSHGDLPSYPDSNFHYPYPGASYYHNGPPVVDPNFIKDLHEQAEMQKLKKDTPSAKHNPGSEEMDTMTESAAELADVSTAVPSSDAGVTSTSQDVQQEEEMPVLPEKPTEPWACVHCTFINPPGIHICQICCKTSYGNKGAKQDEESAEMRPRSRDSESPLINRDALLNSPSFAELKEAQKDADLQIECPFPDSELSDANLSGEISEVAAMLTTETQTSTSTKTTDVQTQNVYCKSIASSTDSIFPRQEISVQTEVETVAQNCSVATDPMISSQSLESLLSGVSAPPYHNRRAGWGRGTSFSTQSLYERGRSRSPMPRSLSMYNEAQNLGRDPNFPSEEVMHSVSQAWLYTDPMYYKPHNQGLGQTLTKEDYFDGTWGSMDRLNRRVKHKKDKGKVESVRPKFHRSLDDLKSDKRPEMLHTQELLMLQTVKEAERCGFSLEDLHVAYLHCGKENPVYWLEDNWPSMIKNVIALAAKYGEDNEENDVGVITATEAKDALRIHRGDIWDAVTECIENRQRKILELTVRGNFTQKQIADALKHNEGNVELAYADLVRASTRRHKFILSPGLSEDSEDLNLCNPTEDSSADHHVGLSHIKLVRTDVSGESKIEKKKSDFLTKLSAIRTAQSERRKAREEKELIRETITQDYPVSEGEVTSKDKDTPAEITVSISREDSKEFEENIPVQSPVEEVEVKMKPTAETPDVNKNVTNIKEGTEDSIPIDFDTNWSESQGEWIEEYSDEQWEDDSQWVGLGKKFQKMEKEFEEEAMQMAALWEKEELEDDVFEEEAKELKTEAEIVPDRDRKFDEWVKANLKVDSFEFEEEEAKEKALKEDIVNDSLVDSIELEVSRPSPLQHYPTAHDLSLKSQFESDWVDLPADAEIEKLAHDIVCEGSDIENKFEEEEMMPYEEEKKLSTLNDQEGSDEDWEKIEMDEQQLQDVNELDQFAFPDKEGDIEKNIEELDQALMESIISEKDSELSLDSTSEIKIEKDSKVLYKNLESVAIEDIQALTSTKESLPEVPVSGTVEVSPREELPLSDGDQPRPPVRRKSKLNSAAIEQALKNHAEISADIPPVLPEKMKNKESQPNISDLYAMPDKATKVNQEPVNLVSEETERSVPQKPPRLNLSPEVPPKRIVSKDASPVTSLSNESDSNCFADSESDTEIKLHRQKNIHRKPPKYENEIEDAEIETVPKTKLDKMAFDEKSDVLLESNLDFELDDDIDPALVEPLPPMKSIDFDPELPILLGGRGSRLGDLDDVDAPKAFREDTTRPLQLFKATKRETPTNTLSMSTSTATGFETIQTQSSFEQQVEETSFIMRTKDELPAPPLDLALSHSMPVFEQENAAVLQDFSQFPVSSVYENQVSDKYYYNETIMPTQPEVTEGLPEKWEAEPPTPEQTVSLVGFEQNIEQVVEPPSTVEEQEIGLSEMEGMSAAVDYFFGRYNEITVTRPKKKTPVRPKPASPSPKPMSSSEIAPPTKTEAPSEMEKSAAAVLETQENLKSKPCSDLDTSIAHQQLQQKEAQITSASVTSREMPSSVDKVKEPAPNEYLPFAEDYLFGCYNEVVVIPRKKKTIALAPIPKLGASLTKTQNVMKGQKPPVQEATPPDQSAIPPEPSLEESKEELSKDENVVPSETSSLIYDEVFHDLPTDILSNQSFDDGGSIYYESFQDAVEEIQDTSSVAGNAVNVKAKTVHFEEPTVPVAPPRKNKAQPGQKPKSAASAASSESYADEYLFRQYEERPQAKKKLPVCSEDFRMKQGFEPTEFPCDTPLLPDEQQEGVISSEISVETPQKTIDSLKNNLEYDVGDSEQSLDTTKHEIIEPNIVDMVSSSVAKDSSISDGFSVVATMNEASDVGKDNMMSTDIQVSKNAGSFEELFLPDQPEDITHSLVVSSDMYLTEESKILSDDLTSNALESSNNMQPPRPCKPKPYDQGSYPSAPSGLEMDQFVFIEQTQDIIDDSYTLYDIQESLQSSLACDLNYIDVKNNIEDECTDDSEKEWKRNEDIKNSLNASFLNTASSEKDFDDQVETILDISEKSSLDENKDHYPEVEELKKEKLILKEENKIFTDKNYFESLETPMAVTESCISEQSDYIVINSEISETFGNQLSSEFSEDIKEMESDYESKDSFSVNENLTEYESAQLESSEKLTTSEERVESSSKIPHEVVESVIQPLSVLCQAVTEVSDTVVSPVIAEDLFDIQEDTLEFSEEVVIPKLGYEEGSVTEDQQIDILEDLEVSGELSDNGNDLSDDSLAPSTHSSVSTQIAVSMKLGLKEPEPDESSLFEFSENLENDNEISAVMPLPTSTFAEKLSTGEETFPLESGETENIELTQTVSNSESVSTEEYESEIKVFDNNIEQAVSDGDKFTPTPPLESESYPNLDRYSPEMGLEKSDTIVTHILEGGLEISLEEHDLRYEKSFQLLPGEKSLMESTDKIATEFVSEELLQSSDAENTDEVVLEPIDYPGIYDVYEIKDNIKIISEDTIDENIDINNSVSEYGQIKEDEAETDQGLVHSESIIPEDTQFAEIKIGELESIETTTDSLLEEENIEESSLSIMSHFYDEWYQNVQPSTQFSLLSIDSIYAKYGTSESSESGNESADDNVVSFKPSENIMQEDEVSTTEKLADQITLKDQVKDVDIIMIDLSGMEKNNFMHDVKSQNIAEQSDFDNISSQTDFLHKIHEESGQKWEEDQEISQENITEESISINDFMPYDTEITKAVTFVSENQESVLSIEEQDTSETKLVENKFSTSKSCQTEDSFEEDIFFDSFDDTFTIPSYIHLPIEVQTKPQMSDISIQCELISSEAITAKVTSSVTEIQAVAAVHVVATLEDAPTQPKSNEEVIRDMGDDKDESSCESFEESDSDFFIDSHSSHDELEMPSGKRGLLCTEIDSDTGFSSGSECGWTKKREKQIKGKKTSVTDVQLQEISSTIMNIKKEISGSVQTSIVSEGSSTVKREIAQTLNISEKSMISGNIEEEYLEKDSEISDAKVCPFPPEIIERAVTPVAVPQFSSFEEDLVFVEVEENLEEISEEVKEEVVSTTPTVEYFYGPLPGTVKVESPPDLNERFFETASELSESLSFPLDSTESFSDSSVTFSEKIPKAVNVLYKDTEMLEEESFVDTCSSFKTEDSISEYYALPESITSKTEKENLILPETKSSEVPSDKALTNSTTVTCDKDIKIEQVQTETSQEKKSLEIAKSKENVVSEHLDTAVISSEPQLLEAELGHEVLSEKETFSKEVTVSVESQKIVYEENVEIIDAKIPGDLGLVVWAENSKSQIAASNASVADLSENECVKTLEPSADVPSVPSDIVRYLYYDDSITFDDDSYHTQSEMLEFPPLPADESRPIVYTSAPCETTVMKDAETLQDTVLLKESADKVCTEPTIELEKQLEGNIISELVQDFVSEESIVQESPELTKISEESTPEEIRILSASELKLATVEIISAENVIELSSGQIPESVQNIVSIDENVPEPVISKNISALPMDSESQDFQPIELKKTSPEVPQVPSDIVRYLYYDDDITFEETTDVTFDDISFHSQSDALALPSDDKMTQDSDRDVPEISDLDIASAENLELMEELENTEKKLPELIEDDKMKLLPEKKKDSFEDSSYNPESSSVGEVSIPPLDSSECVDKWFDIEADPSVNGKKERPMDSEQHSSTKSSALKDSEQPCIPEYILSPIPEGNLPATKTDIDEVTDISTHFTMTDDSDKFSDIESDTSLNFEDECILPLEIVPVEIENAVLFESSIDEGDEDMNLPTPEVKCLPGGFQFPTPELSSQTGEFIQKSVEPIEPQEEFDECVTSTEFSDHCREQFAECLTSSEVNLGKQPLEEVIAVEFSDNEPKELLESEVSEIKEHFTEPLTSSDHQPSKGTTFYETAHDHTDQEFKEFLECDNLNEISELSKEQFSECLTSNEDHGMESVSYEVHLNKELMEKMEEHVSSVDVSEHFTECMTSSELLSAETGYEISQANLNQQLKELSSNYLVTDLRDENGNIPENTLTGLDLPAAGMKIVTASEKLELSYQLEKTENTSHDREEDFELSCYISPIEEAKVESSFLATEEDAIQVCTEDSIVSSETKELKQTVFDNDEDIDESCYTAPNEDSLLNEEDSISTEMTDNWVDAESKNIEVDESIYDLPLEEMNYTKSEVSNQNANLSEESYFDKIFESISYKEKVFESGKSDIISSEEQKTDTPQTETFILPLTEEIKSDITAKAEELSDKFASFSEDEKAVSIAKDLYQVWEEKETLKINEHQIAQLKVKESPKDSTIFAEVVSSEKCLETSNFNISLLSSDIKDISEVKLETESEMRTAVQEEVNIECVSALSGTEPKFLLGGTMYDTLEKETEVSSKELCEDEKVIPSSSSVANEKEDSLESKSLIHVVSDDNAKVVESVLLGDLEVKQILGETEVRAIQLDLGDVPQKENIATDKIICESLQLEKEPELGTLTTQPETTELLEASDYFSAECIAAATSESIVFENIFPAGEKVIYEEPDFKEVLKVESTEISAESKVELIVENFGNVDKKNVVEDADIHFRKPETSGELVTANFKGEFSVDSCEKEFEVVLKKPGGVSEKELDKKSLSVDVDSQLGKSETSEELETSNFKAEFSVDTFEKEPRTELKESICIVEKEDVENFVPVNSQCIKPKTFDELESYNFKSEILDDSWEKETKVVLKKLGDIPDKEINDDSGKTFPVTDEDSQCRNTDTSAEIEAAYFKQEFPIKSCEKESIVVIKESIDSATDTDSVMSEVIDFKMESPGTEIAETMVFIARKEYKDDVSSKICEVVDFKMLSNGTDFKEDKINEVKLIEDDSADFKGQITAFEEKITEFIEQTSRSHDVQDFTGIKEVSHKIIEPSETVDFKGQSGSVDSEKFKMTESSIIVRGDTETRFTTDDTCVVSNNKITSSESVDFKGTVDGISTPTELKKEETLFARQDTYKMPPTTIKQVEANDALSDVVDFRGQVLGEDFEVKTYKKDVMSESIDYSKSREAKEKLRIFDDSNAKLKIDGSLEIVDFKGQIISSDELYERKPDTTVNVKDTTIYTEMKEYGETGEIFEGVDFKACIDVGGQNSQERDVTIILKDAHSVREVGDTDVLKCDTLEEITDFRGSICSGTKALDSQPVTSKENIDTSQLLFKDKTIEMDTVKNICDEEITFESHEKVCHEQNVATYSVSSEASVEESSELYSCVETLSATDTSMQFYSLSDDLDDALNAMSSEDFTDVPSHFTSTEDSDKWSDVEGDLSLEDVEFDRDKTPTRTEGESITTGEITETKNLKHKTLVQEEVAKATLEKIALESSADVKSIQKEFFSKDEESISDSASDEVFSDTKPKKSNIISYPESFDSSTATGPMNLNEEDIQDVGYISKDLLPKQGIVDSKVSESSQKDISEALLTPVDEGTAKFLVTRKSEENTKEIIVSSDNVTKLPETYKTDDIVLKYIGIEEISHTSLESSTNVDFKGCDLIESFVSNEVLSNCLNETEIREEHISSDSKTSFTDKEEVMPPAETTELLPTNEFIDFSVSTSTTDYTDVSNYQPSTESSEKWSDVESEDLKVDFKGTLESGKKSPQDILNNCHNQAVFGDTMKLDMEPKRGIDNETEKDSIVEAPLMEHFAAIKSLNEPLTVANTFSSFDAETAVSKTHEDSTDISSQFEKTESECWLEVATDNSVSEFAEDVALAAEGDEKKQVAFSDKIVSVEADTCIPHQLHSEVMQISTMSTSSSYTDLDNLDQTSDTCADISLQGATTESSDRWSDIEAEAIIDDVLYGNTDLTENMESVDFVQSIKNREERKKKEKDETSLLESQPIPLSSVESTDKITSKSEPLVMISPERKSEAPKSSSLSFESLSINLTDSGQSSIPTELSLSSALSSPSNVTATVLSDDDLTNVTPLDVTTEESDKWSDISGDTSIEEIVEDSSVSLKSSLKLQESESGAVLSEFKADLPVKESDGLAVEEREGLDVRLSKTEVTVKETVTQDSLSEKKVILSDIQKQQDHLKTQKDGEATFQLSESLISQKSSEKVRIVDTQSSEMACISDYTLKAESKTERELSSIGEIDKTDVNINLKLGEVAIDISQLQQQIQTEDTSDSRITDESETLDTYTDVFTQPLSPETSEAYCELESDHSVEDIETQLDEGIETHHIQLIVDTSRQTVSECYENSLTTEELVENADEYGLDTIPENELENYEDEEYSLSEHFEINEDELIYPLPYNDWIEQSFELKEYGIEAAFSESGSDIHGLGIVSDIHGLGIADEEYDDEDIQRAIDFNISNFEDEGGSNIENVGTTESFKTLSNDVSPHLKHSDKEFDSWSTADAPSIEEEDFVEHDNILSKIDELLAEDFGDLVEYQAESPLKHEQDPEDYLFKDISTPEYLHSEDYAEIKEYDLPVETLLHSDKESEKNVDSKIISNKEDLKKYSEIADPLSCDVTFGKNDKIITTEHSEVAAKKNFKLSEPESVSGERTFKKDSKISESEAVSSQLSLKKDSNVQDSETVVAKICQGTDSKAHESELLESKVTLKKDFEFSESKAETVSSPFSLKKGPEISDSKTVVSKICQKKDSKTTESKLVSSEIALKKDSELFESETVTSKLSMNKDSIVSECESVSDEMALQKNSKVPVNETVSSKFSLIKDSKLSEPETESSKTSDKDSKTFETEAVASKKSLTKDSKLPDLDAVSGEITLLKDAKTTETVSSKISIKKDSKQAESEKVSVKQNVRTSTEEVEKAAAVCEDKTKVTKSNVKTSLSSSEEAATSRNLSSAENKMIKETTQLVSSSDETTTMLLSLAESKVKKETIQVVSSLSEEDNTSLLLSSDESIVKKEYTQGISLTAVQRADVETEVSVQLKSAVESAVVDCGKNFTLTSDEASTSIILSSKDSQIKNQLGCSTTSPASETNTSFDIPSKQLRESSAASATECTVTETTTLSEKKETIQSSQLSDSLNLMLTSQSNIPDQKVQDNLSEKSVSETLTIISKEQISANSVTVEMKPDIPRKVKRKSLDTREVLLKENVEKKPSLPPKLSKRHSTSGSPSGSSPSESLSSSSSMESIGSFESATSGRSRKSSLKSSEDTSYHSESPEVPARRSRSSKLSSSSRSRSRDSEDSSSSSSLRIKRRSSNFREPEAIDLSKKRASIDERMQKLQNEGKCATKEKAFIAAKLIEMQFEEEDALLASRQCNTVYNAVKFLTQLCELCNCRFPINLMTSMVHCTHRACRECLKAHFTSLIYDRSIFTLLCPICHKPDITDQNIQEYFNHLDMMLRNILEDRVYDLFQRKLRDEVLTKDPNFHWCSQCSSGFIASPRLKKLYCPDCSAITCALCHQTWELEHEGVHCERFQQWKDMHTPEPPPAGLVKFLVDRGVSCPSCGIVYAQACGGCMMYKCSHCSFEFCGFCIRPLKRGRECSNDICESRGLHIHHDHNCLFYLRDKDISEIQMLLEEESVTYLTIPPKDQIVKSRCQVREQKYAHGVIAEDRCGRDIEPYCGGLCRTHYYEYLAELLRQNGVSPLSIMTIQDLQSMLRKSRVLVPERMKGETSEDYYDRLLKVITSTLT